MNLKQEKIQEVTEVLDGSEYVTFSYMIPSILGLINKLDCSTDYSNESNDINFETPDLAFDDNIGFVDAQKEEEAKAVLREKYNNIKSLHQSLLTLINQPLDFIEEQLLVENSRKELYQIYQKTFIKLIFMHNTVDEPIDEISYYLSLPDASYNHNPFHW
ncbi:12181_t:CDS:2 [Cetraspora pellucida]|uniref:12181_t:CDS:1 n=1 Tax=Cetraspora pellucida TaxID=1433469 RepID=A0A9N9HWK0_9GLOM|nr:12181_t:CDS:2 [Cetraspora pellucida]